MKTKNEAETRRDFLKKAAYAAPVILTLKAVPAFASNGSRGQARRACPFGDC
jgi:hypothetical protein